MKDKRRDESRRGTQECVKSPDILYRSFPGHPLQFGSRLEVGEAHKKALDQASKIGTTMQSSRAEDRAMQGCNPSADPEAGMAEEQLSFSAPVA
jgi:hypothetical protein